MSVVLYTWAACKHCEEVRQLFEAHDVDFAEQPLDGDRALKARLAAQLGRADMPFALVDGELLGGVAEIRRWVEDGGEAR